MDEFEATSALSSNEPLNSGLAWLPNIGIGGVDNLIPCTESSIESGDEGLVTAGVRVLLSGIVFGTFTLSFWFGSMVPSCGFLGGLRRFFKSSSSFWIKSWVFGFVPASVSSEFRESMLMRLRRLQSLVLLRPPAS